MKDDLQNGNSDQEKTERSEAVKRLAKASKLAKRNAIKPAKVAGRLQETKADKGLARAVERVSKDSPSPRSVALSESAEHILRRATEVIGDQARALRWLGTPVRALNYATPISLIGEEAGTQAVLSVLGRLEHGVL